MSENENEENPIDLVDEALDAIDAGDVPKAVAYALVDIAASLRDLFDFQTQRAKKSDDERDTLMGIIHGVKHVVGGGSPIDLFEKFKAAQAAQQAQDQDPCDSCGHARLLHDNDGACGAGMVDTVEGVALHNICSCKCWVAQPW